MAERNITACIPPKKNRKSKPPYDWRLYKKRYLIENMFAKLKDWRRVATRYDRCAHTFMSAIHIAAMKRTRWFGTAGHNVWNPRQWSDGRLLEPSKRDVRDQ
ncbi:hypothetical protein [Acetobacter nitrogenifigens]|uniref:hypothetical protein n=1 Tax=Acetobacter nitrogenifigens TaxID=285268 RepID=UPI0038CF5F8E